MSDLREACDSFYGARGRQYGFQTRPASFNKALDELEGSFIRIERASTDLFVSCHNPSLLDFFHRRFSTHSDESNDVLRWSVFFEQIERLFEVFDVGGARRKKQHTLDPTVIEDAIERTLLARTVRFTGGTVSLGVGSHIVKRLQNVKRSRRHVTIWERLRSCCRIGTMIVDKQLRTAIQEHIDTHMKEIGNSPLESVEIVRLCDVVDGSKWIKPSLVERWHQGIWAMLIGVDGEFEEPLEGLSVLADWFVGNRERFDHEQTVIFEDRLASAVTHEVEHNSESGNPERLGGDLATVEEIAKVLKREFTDEIRWLNESLADCGSPDRDEGEEWRARRAGSSTSSIESIFEALIE